MVEGNNEKGAEPSVRLLSEERTSSVPKGGSQLSDVFAPEEKNRGEELTPIEESQDDQALAQYADRIKTCSHWLYALATVRALVTLSNLLLDWMDLRLAYTSAVSIVEAVFLTEMISLATSMRIRMDFCSYRQSTSLIIEAIIHCVIVITTSIIMVAICPSTSVTTAVVRYVWVNFAIMSLLFGLMLLYPLLYCYKFTRTLACDDCRYSIWQETQFIFRYRVRTQTQSLRLTRH